MNDEKREEGKMSDANENTIPRLDKKDLCLSLSAVLLCGCVLSGAVPTAWIGLASAALFAYVVIAVRGIGSVVQLLLVAILATTVTFLPASGAVVLSLMLGTGTLAWLFVILPKYKWAPIGLLLVAYTIGWLVTADLITPLLALAFLPAAALMAWAHVRDLGRTSTVLHALLGFLLTVLTVLYIVLWRAYGSVNYDVLMRFVNEIKTLFVTVGSEMGKMLWETVEASAAQSAMSAESLEKFKETYGQIFAEGNLRVLIDSLMGLAPALITVPLLIISYLSDVVLLRKYYNTEWRSRMTPAACTITISPAAAIIYFVCLLVVLFVNTQSVVVMAIYNMCLILLPGLCLIGFNVFLQNIKRARGWMGVASIVFFVSILCCVGASSLYFVALWGAYAVITAALHKKIMEKMKDKHQQ